LLTIDGGMEIVLRSPLGLSLHLSLACYHVLIIFIYEPHKEDDF